MRIAIVVADGGLVVQGLKGCPRRLRVWISDREANGEAFVGERVVRLPRRFSRGRSR